MNSMKLNPFGGDALTARRTRLVFNYVAASPPVTTELVHTKRRKSRMDHRLEAGATLLQEAARAL